LWVWKAATRSESAAISSGDQASQITTFPFKLEAAGGVFVACGAAAVGTAAVLGLGDAMRVALEGREVHAATVSAASSAIPAAFGTGA
jgi:hypothetical protein